MIKGYKPCFSCATPRATSHVASVHVPPRSCTARQLYNGSLLHETGKNYTKAWDWCKGPKESVDIVNKCLPRETEKDVNDDSCQLYTLFPVLPQHSCQGSQGRLCTHRHTILLLRYYTYTGTVEADKDKGLTQLDDQKRDFKPRVVSFLISKIMFARH